MRKSFLCFHCLALLFLSAVLYAEETEMEEHASDNILEEPTEATPQEEIADEAPSS